ncbi:hypothetical protein QTP88_025466 [Uroleucon formosanum]
MVDVGANGRISDGGVLYYTKFWEQFQNRTLNIPPPSCLTNTIEKYPYVFLGDEAFSLQTYLMKPYSQHDLTNKRHIFNYRLSRAHRVVENAFGILASRFGVFQKPINLEPDKASTITLACCYLHNFLIENNKHLYVSKNVLITENLGTGELQIGDEITENVLTPFQRNKSANAKIVREKYCDYFCEEGMFKSIPNDLISCISEFLINQIKNEIKQCKFYSIQIDDTTDISQKTQCSIIIRYVTDKSELVERFLGFHNVSEDRTAQGLFNLVNSVLHEFDIENKLVGQCYDGACVMSGHLTGLQARVKEVAPNALFTHCLAHRLNLVLQHGCSINAKCRIFFANLTGIAAYFHNSTSRTNFVDTIVGKRIPQFVQTRWSSRSKILHTIVNEWSGFINVFDCISKDPKSSSESICGAIGHFKNLKTFEFAFLALVFNDIFIYTDNLFNILQNKSFDVEFCLRKINITYDLINKKRDEPEFLKLFNQAVTLTKPPKATRNESNNQSNFKILFYEIIDNILMQLNTRFQDTNKLLFLQLADVTKFKEYSCTFPVNALNNLKSTYPNIFYNINTLKVELEVLYSDVKYQNLLHIYDMVKIIEQDALKDILPEAYKLFILILTIPSTSVSNERSFSCLKRIKTCSRNSISQVRLSSLSILSIEKSLINQLKKTESFYDDIINMYSSQKDRSINLTYKT